jgi:hypothetical protein
MKLLSTILEDGLVHLAVGVQVDVQEDPGVVATGEGDHLQHR